MVGSPILHHESPVDDRLGFLTALLTNLDERGDPRGEFLRLAAARLATTPDSRG